MQHFAERPQVLTSLLSLRLFQKAAGNQNTSGLQKSFTSTPLQQSRGALGTALATGQAASILQTAKRSPHLPDWLSTWQRSQPVAYGLSKTGGVNINDLLTGCEAQRAPLRVALLLSGGVDSSLALQLAIAAGHHVTAFYLRIWFQEDFRNFWDACPWEDDLQVCQQVCEEAGVPLEVVPLSQQYWDRVVHESVSEIRAGRTPNPDILCNSRVKFGAFLEHLQHIQESQGVAYDRVASGHYARLLRNSTSHHPVRLALTPDSIKDQTYFLARLSQDQLQRCMFPLGALTKAQVRQLAAAADLPNQARRDSQGICFLGKLKFDEFVREHLGEWPGPLIDDDSGKVVGYHKGFWFHTVGQRRGINLSGGPWYVAHKDLRRNAVYITRSYYEEDRLRNRFHCGNFNWTAGMAMNQKGTAADVRLEGNDQGLAPGQSAVFYQDNICLGAATILGSAAFSGHRH
ncbi:hypothetical protein WJX74_000884 [Apatococcus lobatus]|uniref:tRNA-5-taurinomethyluridine 2-sulfurtransferase n=1 Tax=Apatococcus lobatus TaxID=904363 RepID=A0AAW1QC46_9CHLO